MKLRFVNQYSLIYYFKINDFEEHRSDTESVTLIEAPQRLVDELLCHHIWNDETARNQ